MSAPPAHRDTRVARAIKGWRARFMHTQREAAAFLGITPAYLNDIEHGRRDLTDTRIMGCPQSELRAALVDARCAELADRTGWLKAHRDAANSPPAGHFQEAATDPRESAAPPKSTA